MPAEPRWFRIDGQKSSAARSVGMDDAPTFLTGRLLLAMPGMGDPNFERAVIAMVAHDANGAMGIGVGHTRAGVSLHAILEELEIDPGAAPDCEILHGGPVETGRGFVLHSADYTSGQGTMQVSDRVAMTATLDILEDIAEGRGPERSMLALGYSGWGPGQLEGEIAQNGWLTVGAQDDIVFGRANEHKWSAALKALGVDPLTLSDVAGHA